MSTDQDEYDMIKSRSKEDNVHIRKKFRKGSQYRCCGISGGNRQKFSSRYCCTYPMIYKRYDITLQNHQMAKSMDDEIYVY